MRLAAVLLLVVVAGCAQLNDLAQRTRSQVTLVEGLRKFDAGEQEAAAKTLAAAIKMGLGAEDRALAHRHLAFIHCSAGREAQCREEFRKALAADPGMQLEPAEAGHPIWGPIFRSMSGPGALSAGLKQYESGDYEESAKNLQGAIDLGVAEKERANAHKHLAFIHCSSNRVGHCRDEFRKALAIDPALELAPAEAGHPVWGPIFRSLKTGR
jgi:Tfp pilus assembly protein PilF